MPMHRPKPQRPLPVLSDESLAHLMDSVSGNVPGGAAPAPSGGDVRITDIGDVRVTDTADRRITG